MKKQLMTHFTLLTFLISCNGGGGSGKPDYVPRTDFLETEMHGTYKAMLRPLNPKLTKMLNGSLTLLREKDEFVAHVRLSAGPASVLHVQNIHIGKRCPTMEDDLNSDGFIDGDEGAQVYKEVIIPLDEDLNSQRMGGGTFPLADEYGYYSYSQVASFDKLLADLRDEDINPHDDYVKLGTTENLQLLGNVIVITGVPKETSLPDTVAPRGRLTGYQALPVACGVIKKLTSAPGRIDDDRTGIPYPGGESVGGSSGADDGADFASSSTTSTTGGNYGEEDNEVDEPETGSI